MKIFVTGATGFIGSAVVRELLNAHHQVLGLARSDEAAAALAKLGGEPHRGSLEDSGGLASAAKSCDGVIHLAHELIPQANGSLADGLAASMERDLAAIHAMGDALAGSGKPFVGTTGTMLLTAGRVGTEEDAADPGSAAGFRVPSENAVLALAARGVRACVVRPAPSVHGPGDKKGFAGMFIRLARAKGISAYVRDGANRWTGVHRLDAAKLFALAVERGEAGQRFHAVEDEGTAFRDIAGIIGRQLKLPVRSLTPNEAAGHFGPLAFIVPVDNPASNTLTRQRLGWKPEQPSLLADLERSHYFAA